MILLALTAPSVAAQSPMSGAEFEAHTRGKTLFFGFGGQVYGAERYLPGRRVIWSYLDGDCLQGIWYPHEGQICFAYEGRADPQCWVFTESGGRLTAQREDGQTATELYEAGEVDAEMVCYGPEVGV